MSDYPMPPSPPQNDAESPEQQPGWSPVQAPAPEQPPYQGDPEPPRKKKGQSLLAWAVIALMVAVTLFLGHVSSESQPVDEEQHLAKSIVRMQSQYVVGAQGFVAAQGQQQAQDLFDSVAALNTGPVWQRLRYITLAGDMKGPQEALDFLDALEKELAEREDRADIVSERQDTSMEILRRIYGQQLDAVPPVLEVSDAERETLRAELGWFGDLALAPAGLEDAAGRKAVLAPTGKVMVGLIGIVGFFGLMGLFGLVGLIFLLIMALKNKLAGSIFRNLPHGGVYAETFALWMVLFLALQVVGALLVAAVPKFALLAAGLGMLFSMAALAWPVMRGIPLGQVMKEVGLHGGRKPWAEPFIGIAGYAITIPILAVGFVMTAILTTIDQGMQGDTDPFVLPDTPSHPIMEAFSEPGLGLILQVFFVASVCAPIVEETMFRGVLYRHLREAFGSKIGVGLNIALSAFLSSFVFAVIHPQGWVAVPALMSLAIGMCIVREWRDSLIAPMVLHGVHNGLLMTIAIVLFT